MQIKLNRTFLIVLFSLSTVLFASCEDYFYEKEEPTFLGASIYDYLKEDGNFKYFTRLIDDLGYTEVLSKTGSKTLFPATDEAFERFFKGNAYGVKSYEELSFAQKRSIMNVSMVNMAYLSYMLSNAEGESGKGEGLALRHNTANTYLDSITMVTNEVLFENPYWKRFSGKGLYVADDGQAVTMVHFTPQNMAQKNITATDFTKLYNGMSYTANDIFINGIKITKRDIICKNGYIHVLEDVMIPGRTMDEIIASDADVKLFNKLMNKFSAPFFIEGINERVHAYYNGVSPERPLLTDSIFVKRYFTSEPERGTDPNKVPMANYGLLYYSPADLQYSDNLQDMAAMFVPSDKAMDTYINSEKGRYLKDAFGTWDNIPTPLLALFVKNHQKKSFQTSVPHTWPTLTDESSFDMNINPSDIYKTYVGTNGAVYVSNNVYPPIDYQCVYGSVLISPDAKIMNWAIQDGTMKFFMYLRSMENMYNLIVPIDEAFDNYRDPIAWAKGAGDREIWSFKYMPVANTVEADVYNVDASGNKGTFKRRITDATTIRNRLNDIVDMHIVVGEKKGEAMTGYIDDGQTKFALTKGGTTLKIADGGDNTKMTGGGDIEQNIKLSTIVTNPANGKKRRYDSSNGRTYFIDQILQDPSNSVYTNMGKHAEYTAFFDLLKGDARVFDYFVRLGDKDVTAIFDTKITAGSNVAGVGYVVSSFNNFRYTVFVPTKAALDKAFATDSKLYTWDEIANDADHDSKKEKTLYLLNFLKYHFMDNSVFISGKAFSKMTYETAARNASNKFYKLTLSSNGSNLVIEGEGASKANVIKTDGLFNLMSRDYMARAGTTTTAPAIEASSRSVMHLIDNVLKYE